MDGAATTRPRVAPCSAPRTAASTISSIDSGQARAFAIPQLTAAAPEIATLVPWVGRQQSSVSSSAPARSPALIIPIGLIRMGAPLVSPNFPASAAGTPFFRRDKARIELGPSTSAPSSSAPMDSAQARISRATLSGTTLPLSEMTACATARVWAVSSVVLPAARPSCM